MISARDSISIVVVSAGMNLLRRVATTVSHPGRKCGGAILAGKSADSVVDEQTCAWTGKGDRASWVVLLLYIKSASSPALTHQTHSTVLHPSRQLLNLLCHSYLVALIMTTFISCQPWGNAPSFRGHSFEVLELLEHMDTDILEENCIFVD